jgi:predicted MFS family arabinose efflux permease
MSTSARPTPVASPWRATLAAFCASLVGIGLARFAYTPLLPVIVDAHWFAASSAAYLGAANLAGYLAGALLARSAVRVWTSRTVIRGMMLLASIALAACAWPWSFAWFFAWRFASGLAGGVLMVLAAPAVLAHVPASRRGLASGVIFMGVGAGIAASGTVVPLLLREGLVATWLSLGGISLLLTAVAWGGWPGISDAEQAGAASAAPHIRPQHETMLRGLYAEYALSAVGLVPHMIFLVDYVARGLGQGTQVGSAYWVLFGLGALVGPVLTGHLADRVGFGRALRLAYLLEAVTVALPALGWGAASLMLSSFVVGAFTPGIVPLALGRINELLPHHPAQQKAAWSRATISFAVLQAVAAYAMSYLFTMTASYALLFVCGSVALLAALAIDAVLARLPNLQPARP